MLQDWTGMDRESNDMNLTFGKNMRQLPTFLLPKMLLGLLCLTLASPAHARLSTSSYTCSDLKDLVFQQGAIVLNIKGNSVYRRFVADASLCKRGEVVRRINVPTKSEKCRLRHCLQSDSDRNN